MTSVIAQPETTFMPLAPPPQPQPPTQPPSTTSATSSSSSASSLTAHDLHRSILARSASSFLLEDDDFGSSDEIKIFKDEGDDDDKDFSALEELQAALLEEKSSLILETEMAIKQECLARIETGKSSPGSPYSNGYPLMSPFPYQPPDGPQGSHPSLPPHPPPPHSSVRSPSSPSPLSPFVYNDPLGSPPPAHIGGIPYSLDSSKGLRPHPIYPSMGHYPYSLLSSVDVPQFSPCGPLSRFGPGSLLPSPDGSPFSGSSSPSLLGSHPSECLGSRGMVGPSGPRNLRLERENSGRLGLGGKLSCKPHIKKPLNAFMLYMKEMRPKIVAECTLKESAAINQILGRRWHSLSRDEQAKYYEMARKERQLHMQMYPGWSARDNYAQSKKRKRKRNKNEPENNVHFKKFRSRCGVDQSDVWCKPCNRDDLYSGMLISSPSSSSSSTSSQVVGSLPVEMGPESHSHTSNDINGPQLSLGSLHQVHDLTIDAHNANYSMLSSEPHNTVSKPTSDLHSSPNRKRKRTDQLSSYKMASKSFKCDTRNNANVDADGDEVMCDLSSTKTINNSSSIFTLVMTFFID